jgi:hypothetical protein
MSVPITPLDARRIQERGARRGAEPMSAEGQI